MTDLPISQSDHNREDRSREKNAFIVFRSRKR